MPGCVITLPKMVSKRLDLSFGIFARRGEKYSCYAAVPQLSANSGETIRRLCLEGNGIACLSDFTVAADIAAGHLHELLPDRALNEAKPFYAVYYGDNAVSPKIQAFVDFLAERLGEKRAGAT